MEKNVLKVNRAKTEHLQTTGDTGPVRMKRYIWRQKWASCQQSNPLNILAQQ